MVGLCGCFWGLDRQPPPPPSRPGEAYSSSVNQIKKRVCGDASGLTVSTSQSLCERSTRIQGLQHERIQVEEATSQNPSAQVSATVQGSQAVQVSPDRAAIGGQHLTETASNGVQQSFTATSAVSVGSAIYNCPGAAALVEGPVFLPKDAALRSASLPAVSAGQPQAELGELQFIGQGATGLVYSAVVTQLCPTDAGIMDTTTPLPAPVTVAVKFMICNTPQQLWQRAKEALLSKLVSHPNLVRTLAMDVTLVTPNTYSEWGNRPYATIDLIPNAPADRGDAAAFISAGMPSAFPWNGSSSSLAAAASGGGPPATLAYAKPFALTTAAMIATTTTSDNSDTLPVAVVEELLAPPRMHPDPALSLPLRPGPASHLPPSATSAAAAKSHPASHPQVERLRELSGGSGGCLQRSGCQRRTLQACSLGPVHAVVQGRLAAGALPFAVGGGGEAVAPSSGSPESDAQCTVGHASELWPGCSIFSASVVGSHAGVSKAASAALEPSWAQPVRGSSSGGRGCDGGSGGDGVCVAVGGDAESVLRRQLSSGLMRSSATPGEGEGRARGQGGGSSSGSGSVGLLGAAGEGTGRCLARPPPSRLPLPVAAPRPPLTPGGQTMAGQPIGNGTAVAVATVAAQGLGAQRARTSGDGALPAWVSVRQGGFAEGGNPGGGSWVAPVLFQDILYHLEAIPGRFLAKVVMEYCDSGTLLQRINAGDYVAHPDKGQLASLWALRALLRCLQEVAAGMCHLHSLNIIHGDLKPGNVLLTSKGGSPLGYVCKVSDFGLATALEASEQTITHENWGTVVYMAPESCEGRCRKASDVYSFGVLLWQMCCGERPYAGMQAGQVLLGVKTGTLRLQWPAWANKSLVKVGQACLRFDPKDRPGFKGIRSALAKIAVRLDQKLAAVEGAGLLASASLLQSVASSVALAGAAAAAGAAGPVAAALQQEEEKEYGGGGSCEEV